MLTPIKMPSMGATMEEGKIVTWKVREGDTVAVGQILMELESDKSTYELESPAAGTVRKILAFEGETIPVQQLIAVLGEPGEPIPAEWLSPGAKAETAAPAPASASIAAPAASAEPVSRSGDKVKISPRAKKLAESLGMDLSKVVGTGPEGRIESSDVEQAASQKSPAAEPAGNLIPFDAVRRQIARKVIESKKDVPHFYLQTAVDMTGPVAYRENVSRQSGKKVSYNAIFAKAVAEALKIEPSLNYAYTSDGFAPRSSVKVGLAIETPKGVIIAVASDVDKKDVAAINDDMNNLVELARAEKFGQIPSDGACMTISNVGMFGIDALIPIIHPGETAILGIGAMTETPVARNGKVEIRKMMTVSFAVDHRVADGAIAARFLRAFVDSLEKLA